MSPDLSQVRKSVFVEIPAGSSEDDVRRFCEQHQYTYSRTRSDEAWAIHRGSGLLSDDLVLRMTYGSDNRVMSADLNIDNRLP